jgi:saccharopine dehydrogenase (NADP+, L-glutamate forming)
MKKVLVLGAGLVAKPLVRYLLDNGFTVTVASPMKERADEMIAGHLNGSSVYWSMNEEAMLEKMVGEHDLTVSLLPYKYHTDVARVCLIHGKNLVTTSYIQKEMAALERDVKAKGLIFLNEAGLDPGIDHMSAKKLIDSIHSQGGKAEEFYSFCGALPAPEAAGNPLGYKFGWSPRGVMLASRNGALYLKKGKRTEIDPSDLFKDRFPYSFPGIGELEVYPNRDSLAYIDIYGIPEASTMYRGTFRFPGWCDTLDAMKELGMLDDDVIDYRGMTSAEFIAERGRIVSGDIRSGIADRIGRENDCVPVRALDFLGFFDDDKLNCEESSPFDITAGRMVEKMLLRDEERDLVVLNHIILASFPGNRREVIKSSLVSYGSPATDTAISKTVALPAAIASKLILNERPAITGIVRPVSPLLYNPVLEELKTLGIEITEEYGIAEGEMIQPFHDSHWHHPV